METSQGAYRKATYGVLVGLSVSAFVMMIGCLVGGKIEEMVVFGVMTGFFVVVMMVLVMGGNDEKKGGE